MVIPRYYSLDEAIQMIDEPNRARCHFVLSDNPDFTNARGSKTKHQAWPGGYLDHVTDTMNLAVIFHEILSSTGRPLDFTLSDSLLVMFLHDLEKPYKQTRGVKLGLEDSSGKKDDDVIKSFREKLFDQYGFELTEKHLNAVRYIEGENKDYHPTERVMNELAAFCHMCDIWSARGWYDFPKKEDDIWRK